MKTKSMTIWVMLSLFFLVFLFSTGCATQHYGRMPSLGDFEADNLSCREIEIEIDRCNAFIRDVNTKAAKFTGRDVISFLGDFGIGDGWEINDATKSAIKRAKQLQELKKRRNCIGRQEASVEPREEPQFIGVCAKCGRNIRKDEKICVSGSDLLCQECFKKASANR